MQAYATHVLNVITDAWFLAELLLTPCTGIYVSGVYRDSFFEVSKLCIRE
jgi:hypothetical protein